LEETGVHRSFCFDISLSSRRHPRSHRLKDPFSPWLSFSPNTRSFFFPVRGGEEPLPPPYRSLPFLHSRYFSPRFCAWVRSQSFPPLCVENRFFRGGDLLSLPELELAFLCPVFFYERSATHSHPFLLLEPSRVSIGICPFHWPAIFVPMLTLVRCLLGREDTMAVAFFFFNGFFTSQDPMKAGGSHPFGADCLFLVCFS